MEYFFIFIIAALLLPLIPILLKLVILYIKGIFFGYVSIFKTLGPILGTIIGLLFLCFLLLMPYQLITHFFASTDMTLDDITSDFYHIRLFWKFFIICALLLIVQEYYKIIYKIYRHKLA